MFTPDELKTVYAVITSPNTLVPASSSNLIASIKQKIEDAFTPVAPEAPVAHEAQTETTEGSFKPKKGKKN